MVFFIIGIPLAWEAAKRKVFLEASGNRRDVCRVNVRLMIESALLRNQVMFYQVSRVFFKSQINCMLLCRACRVGFTFSFGIS